MGIIIDTMEKIVNQAREREEFKRQLEETIIRACHSKDIRHISPKELIEKSERER